MSIKEIFKVIQSKFSLNTEQGCKNKLTNREVLKWGEDLRQYGVFSVKSKNNDLYEDLYESVPVPYPDNTKEVVRQALQNLNIPDTVDNDNEALIILYQGGYIINGCDERIGAQLNQKIFSHYSDYMIFYITIITAKVAKELYPHIKFKVIFDSSGKPEKLDKANCYYIVKNNSSYNANVEKFANSNSHLQSLGYNLYDNEEQALNKLKNNVVTEIDAYFCDVVPSYSNRFNTFLKINNLEEICTNYNSKSVVVFLRMLMEIYEDTVPQLYNSINLKLLEYAERKISFAELVNFTYSIQEKLTISDKLYNATMDYIIYILMHGKSNTRKSM